MKKRVMKSLRQLLLFPFFAVALLLSNIALVIETSWALVVQPLYTWVAGWFADSLVKPLNETEPRAPLARSAIAAERYRRLTQLISKLYFN